MPVINSKQPVENISVPVPTPVQTTPKQRPPAVVQQQPRPQTPQNLPLSFGGEQDEMGGHHPLSAVILPWVPQQKKLSRKKAVVKYTRPTLTPTQKERAKRVELVVLPKNIEGKKCGTCKYAKKHSKESPNLYCTNNSVHMNVKSNWGCKLWDARGVKRLQRKVIKYSEDSQDQHEDEAKKEVELPDWEPQPKEQLNGKLVEGVLRPMKKNGINIGRIDKQALGALGDHLQEIGHPIGELISRHANGEGTSLNPKQLSGKVDDKIESPDSTHQIFSRSGFDHKDKPITWVSISHWKKVPLPNGYTRLDKLKSYAFYLPK